MSDEDTKRRALELKASGLPYQLALRVARRQISLSRALEGLAREQRVERLMVQHDLNKALATQVALGHAELAQILFRRRLKAYRSEMARWCGLSRDVPLVLGLHGVRLSRGIITEDHGYEVMWKAEDAEPQLLHKLQIKFLYVEAQWKFAKKMIRTRKKASPTDPLPRPQDRYTCSDRRLFRYLESEAEFTVSLLEDIKVSGRVRKFNAYEVLVASERAEVVVMRHAMSELHVR